MRLKILLFFHDREFNKDFFENFSEFEFINLLLMIGFEYFGCEELYEV